jgi:hypothetical protein
MLKSISSYLLTSPICFLLSTFACLFHATCAAQPSLSYQETGRQLIGKPNVTIKLIPEGFPSNTSVNLTLVQVDGYKIHYPEKFLVNEENEIVTLTGEPREFNFASAAKGEPITCKLCSEDKKYTAETKFIPFPNEVMDENGHSLSIRIASRDGEQFMVNAKGFQPNEFVKVHSTSEGEKMSFPAQATKEGTLEAMMAPAVIGKRSGVATLEIKGKTTKDLKLIYEWGLAAFKPYKNSQ